MSVPGGFFLKHPTAGRVDPALPTDIVGTAAASAPATVTLGPRVVSNRKGTTTRFATGILRSSSWSWMSSCMRRVWLPAARSSPQRATRSALWNGASARHRGPTVPATSGWREKPVRCGGLRRYLRHGLGLPTSAYDVMGYWRFDAEAWQQRYDAAPIDAAAIWSDGERRGQDAGEIWDRYEQA